MASKKSWENYKKFVTSSFIYLYEKIPKERKMQFENYILKRKQRHTFHIVSPSPWPVLAALSAFIFVSGLLYFMHFLGGNLFVFGVICLLLIKFFWFRDIIRESIYMGYHSIKVQRNLRLAFMLFIISEVMFFFSFFWAYFHVSFCPSIFVGNIWPPEGIVFFFFSDYINIKSLFLDYYFFSNSWFDNLLVRHLFNSFFTVFPYENHLGIKDASLDYCLAQKREYSPAGTVTNWEINKFINFPTEFQWYAYTGWEGGEEVLTGAGCVLKTNSPGSLFDKTYLTELINTEMDKFVVEDYNYMLYNSSSNIEIFIKSKLKFLNFFCGGVLNPENFFSLEAVELPELSFVKLGFITKNYIPLECKVHNFFTKKEIFVNIYSSGVLVNPYLIPLLNTIILLTSGATLTCSHIGLRLERYLESIFALLCTVLLGIFFFICQFYEYAHASFSLSDGIYGTVFYMLTGFHGFHVLIGTAMLMVCLLRFLNFHFTPNKHFGFEAAIWYWHFVDVVWIFLFFTLYLWPNNYYFTGFYLGENEFSTTYNLSVSLNKIISDEEFFDYSSNEINWTDFAVRALWLIFFDDIIISGDDICKLYKQV